MTNNKSKTKTEILNELESIKGLLHEEDDIPVLQEMIAGEQFSKKNMSGDLQIQQPQANNLQTAINDQTAINNQATINNQTTNVLTRVEQQDFFAKLVTTDSATQLLNTLNDLASLAEAVTAHKITPSQNAVEKNKIAATRPNAVKAAGENPFLPQHIRTRLHGNNPPPFFEIETAKKIANVSRPTTQLGNTQNTSTMTKPVSHQQELIEDIVETMLPEIEQALRERLSAMSKEMLEILIAESK